MPGIKTEDLPEAIHNLRLAPLFNIHFAVEPPVKFGQVPDGRRQTGFITGGEFEGERLRGRVQGGSDWQVIRADATLTTHVQVVLETDDGALIGMFYSGFRRGPADVIAKVDAGEAVDPGEYYFRLSGTFQTSAPRYAWLNGIIAIGTGERLAAGPVYRVFELL